MDEAALREKVGQLLAEVHQKPRTAREGNVVPAPAAVGSAPAMKREMATLEDSLDRIRLAVKYLIFDLEATKRENRLLRDVLGDA